MTIIITLFILFIMNDILSSSCSKMYEPGIQYTCTQGSTVTVGFLFPGSDEEMDKLAEEEEEEALALQKHMAASLEEQDFDTAEFEVRSSWSYTSHRQTS